MSGGSNQRTLFQTWGAPTPQSNAAQPRKDGKKAAGRRRTTPSSSSQTAPKHPPRNPLWAQVGQESSSTSEEPKPAFEDEDDDDLMLVAVYEAEKSLELENVNCQHGIETEDTSLTPAGQTYPDFPGFDGSSAKVWIYPTNYPIREYQLKISEAALFQNSLVCLPTGLGKTFIASVVMYNFYRWYPTGKIVFMAPTKPLVAQQIEACYKVMGIPQAHMAELTGSTAAKQRQEVWRTKRVFFLTPQVMVNDLTRETCPAQQIKCVVIDEAHKALGNHAYCQVIRQLSSQTLQFRILALSATPGGDTKSVQSVISNLLISHIELRSEESPDIQAHSHQRCVEKIVVPFGEKLCAQQARYLEVLEKFMSRLVQNRVMGHKDLKTLCKYQLIIARDQFRKNPPSHIKGPQQGMLEGDFALCISLYHGYELLMQMGLRSLFFYIQGIMDGSREMSRARNELQRTPTFMDLYREMEAMFVKPSAGPDEPFIYSHPKLEKLEGVVLQHFKLWAESSANSSGPQEVSTRVMIFSSFRESVQEIAAMLDRHAPLIRVMTFMGQASTGKGLKGFTQKEQLEVVSRFRNGGFNTLVSTCVGEEGLDIGEVDLIVCFDAQKNPIRMVQRMGRTGRKRQGRIVVILAEGREEKTYNQSQCNKRSVYKSIVGNKNGFHLYPNSPRMLPDGVNPKLHKMYITCGQFNHQESNRRSAGGRRSHSEGRASLIHPQNLIRQGSATSDGFLSTTEYSLWASTMKLEEDEAHPILKQSHFVSLSSDTSLQDDSSKSGPPSRELSLWEWRHWQHKVLPTHVVDHSLRCHHFTKVMELIDSMRDESEGECCYEQKLLPYLQKDVAASGVVDRKQKKKKKEKSTKTCNKTTNSRPKASHTVLSDIDKEEESEKMHRGSLISDFVVRTKAPSVQEDHYDDITDHHENSPISHPLSPEANKDNDCIISEKKEIKLDESASLDNFSQLSSNTDEDVELQAMFYLPSWASSPLPSTKLTPGRDANLKMILASVAELLSRSPPPLEDDLEADTAAPSPPPAPSLQWPPPAFKVSFTLGVDDEEDEDEAMIIDTEGASSRAEKEKLPLGEKGSQICHHLVSGSRIAAESPKWDEVFGEGEEDNVNFDIKEMEDEKADDFEEEFGGEVREEEENDRDTDEMTDGGGANEVVPELDESMDLFGDDEAFLQMSIPNVATPGVTPIKSHKTLSDNMIKTSDALHKHMVTNPGSNTSDTKYTTHFQQAELIAETHNTAEAKKQNPESSGGSHDYFSVNFDLGYSLEESDEEEEEDVPVHNSSTSSPQPKKRALSNSSTPCNSAPRQIIPPQFSAPKLSTPQMLSEPGKRKTSSPLALPLMSKGGELPSPITSPRGRQMPMPGHAGSRSPSLFSRLKRGRLVSCLDKDSRQESVLVAESPPHHQVDMNSDSEEDVVVQKRKNQHKVNLLSSPEVSKTCSVDSPLIVNRKRSAAALNTSDETESRAVSDDDDFQNESSFTFRTTTAERQRVKKGKDKHAVSRKGRQFLCEEAELSEEEEEGADVSSDEDDGYELNCSLEGFVVDNSHFSQGLNDSDMCGVYLKSVRSPAVHSKFKMSYRNQHNMDIFSQVPEQDETYAEDSFVVGSGEEEGESSEERMEDIELMPEDSYVDGRRQYATRRRVFIHRARAGAKTTTEPVVKTKRSRVIRMQDSSEEDEAEAVDERKRDEAGGSTVAAPLWPKSIQQEPSRAQEQRAPSASTSSSSSLSIASKVSMLSKAKINSMTAEEQKERCRQKIESQHLVSDELDFAEPVPLLSPKKQPETIQSTSSDLQTSSGQNPSNSASPAPLGPVNILADSRCISSGVELMACLRQRHAATVHVCSLDATYFIISTRMAAERHSQSDLASMQNRKRLVDRVNSLQGLFERVCLIVEKDKTKPGEASRPFQRTRYYDSTLTALVRTGVRLLWSNGPEDSAALLADLARLEQRKGQGISVPLEVNGHHRQQALQMYSSLPSVNYAQALNMSHNFNSIAQLVNSSVDGIQKGGCMSRSRAEEVYRFLRYSCDSFLVNNSKPGKSSQQGRGGTL